MDSPLKWHGGKHYLAPKLWEIAKTVPHVHRVEVFGGSLAFTLASELYVKQKTAYDIDQCLTCFWDVLQSEFAFHEFIRVAQATPFSEGQYRRARVLLEQWRIGRPVVSHRLAHAFFVACRQSLAGRMATFAPITRRRTRRGMNEQASAWLSAVEGLPAIHERLKRVVILDGQHFTKVLQSQDGEQTLFYCDPPYLPSTRASVGEYAHEMTEAEHVGLLAGLAALRGKFLLSGYRNDLYDGIANANGWQRRDFELPNNAAAGKAKRRMVECVWTNF